MFEFGTPTGSESVVTGYVAPPEGVPVSVLVEPEIVGAVVVTGG